MSLPAQLEKLDASLGRIKADTPRAFAPSIDLAHDVPAAEWEQFKDVILGLSQIGRDGGAVEDDFSALRTALWTATEDNLGTVSIINADVVPASVEGFGWLKLHAPFIGGSLASFSMTQPTFKAGQHPIFRGRVRLPASPGVDTSVIIGFKSASAGAYFGVDGDGFWTGTTDGANGSQTQSSSVLAVGEEYYNLTITVGTEINGEGVRFYVDGAEILHMYDKPPAVADVLGVHLEAALVGGANGDLYVDWIDARAPR